ncbi:asparagine synthase (glutamine-hydrolysing) [Pontibacter ummariensis]|uniref:asparagine synthase (glutamine-hydrolyzing) n=2 Tax=Pontibacter ummariensis TaxID=1610492 RepID=A0A239E3B9_9BACT|nr:asparagine synthase (glutamine-hydrolysing) [Pontibacter ummariensis]SNS38788.1 asparagine synthase (glutamine-hydrolysing) [Pontibacter ummariensis]
MCGITGVYAFTENGRVALNRLQGAVASLRHRGPDAGGVYLHGRVGLGNRRLSIIAPGEQANQPLTSDDGRYTVVFNGEIFNYKQLRAELASKGYTLSTASDTEVLLRLYERERQECLKKLKGFFAVAIYDKAEDSLFVARDRFGEKPLLYYKDANAFLFGSEMVALLELGVPQELDYASLYQYLQLTYTPAPATMLKHVKKLLPGQALYIRGGRVQESVWYRLSFDGEKAAQNPMPFKLQQEKLRQLLQQAVADRMVADVPVGAFLSGGLDSSIVVALAASQASSLKTFSVGFPEQPRFDETAYARLVAEKYKTEHTELLLSNQDLYQHLHDMLNSLSEPLADSSALAVYALSKRASQDVKVVLSGDGADELFAGYNKHRAEYRASQGGFAVGAVTKLQPLWEVLPKSRSSFTANKVRQLQRFAAGARLSPEDRYWLWASWLQEEQALALLKPEHRTAAQNRLYHARKSRLLNCISRNHYDMNNVLCADWHMVLANDMLAKVDLMGMAHGVEVRSPYLDNRLVKFAFSLPVASKIDEHAQKRILRETFKHLLPEELWKRGKQGFEVPLLSFLRSEGRSRVNECLSDAFIIEQGIFEVQQTRLIRQALELGKGLTTQTSAWSLLVFQHWWKHSSLK